MEPETEARKTSLVERLQQSATPVGLVGDDGQPAAETPPSGTVEPDEPKTVRRAQLWYMARGDDVVALQEYLGTLGLYPIGTDDADDLGLFGNTTDASVRGFQRLVGLTDSGIVDEACWYALAHAVRSRG